MPIHLSENARKVLEARYLQRDSSGQIIETPQELFQRVARSIAKAEEQFDNAKATSQWEENFLETLVHRDFLPNSPTLRRWPLGYLRVAQASGSHPTVSGWYRHCLAAIYRQAWEWGLKGITVFRYGSKGQQVLELGEGESAAEREHFAQCDPYACKL
jgi:ribonucleotide reductase alpha subunit